MPCLWPRPERGSNMPARLGSAIYTASPVGSNSQAPGASCSGAASMARRSMPAEPSVARRGSSNSRPRRSSSTLTCKAWGMVCITVAVLILVLGWADLLRHERHQPGRQFGLAGLRQMRLAAIPADEQGIVVAAKGLLRANDIAGDHVHALALALGAGGILQIAGLGGEAEREHMRILARHISDDVARAGQRQRHVARVLLDLLFRHARRAVIGHGRGANEDIGIGNGGHDRGMHVGRAFHVDALETNGSGQR